MRICLISREYPPETGWGGIGTFTHHLAHGLARLGQDVEVVSLSVSSSDPPISGGNGEPRVHRVPSRHMAVKLGFFNFCLPVTRPMIEETTAMWSKFLELHKEKPFDVVECPEHFAEGLFPSIARIAPLVIRLHTPHSKLVKEKFHNFTPSFDHRVLTAMERVAMVSADVLVSPSRDLAGYVARDLNIPLSRIHIVRNPVDVEKFSPDGAIADLDKDAVKILFVGRLEQRKGVHQLVEAVPQVLDQARAKKVHFILAGKDTQTAAGNGSVLAELQTKLRQSGAHHSVTFLEQVPLAQMPDYYRACDIFVLPSLYDNAPMTVIEAMSCGKPVVATSSGGAQEYAVHEKCGFIVPPSDSKALANALSKLVSDDDLRLQMGSAARRHALENFTIEETSAKTVKLYEEAKQVFAQRHTALYTGQPDVLVDDVQNTIDALERTLYEMTYSNSWRFRMKHRLESAQQKPGTVIARALKKTFSKNKPEKS